jgi:hypothetical protein
MEGDEMTPHERLLGDAIRGDAMLCFSCVSVPSKRRRA